MDTTLIDAALTFSTFALMASNPIAAGAVASIEVVFNSLASGDSSHILSDINQVVIADLENQTINQAISQFDTYRAWLEQTYRQYQDSNVHIQIPKNIDTCVKDHPTSPFSTFYIYLQNALINPDSAHLLKIISDLKEPDKIKKGVNFQVKAFNTYLLGISLYSALFQIFYKITILSNTEYARTYAQEFVSNLDDYISYANHTCDYINLQFIDRFRKISPVTSEERGVTGFMATMLEKGWRFSDTDDEARTPTNSFIGLSPDVVYFSSDKDKVIKNHNDYIEKVRKELYDMYFFNSDRINKTVGNLLKLKTAIKRSLK